MKKYLLIDGNNIAARSAFSNKDLTNKDGIPTGVHYGVFNSLISLKRKFPDYNMLMAWDGKSARRMRESKEGVDKGIIPSLYKANRKKDELPKPLLDFYSQSDYLKRGIGQLGIPQIFMNDFEADDILASYCKMLKNEHEVVVVTSDKDYFALLDKNVSIWDGMKQLTTTLDDFKQIWGIEPKQWTDFGALMGDVGDNIFGVPSVGEKTAIKELIAHGSYQNVIQHYEKEYNHFRKTYPDLNINESNREKFEKLLNAETEPKDNIESKDNIENKENVEEKKRKKKFPGIYWNIPYSGVAYEFEFGKIKMPKVVLMMLMFQERVKLAYSLKKIDEDISSLPAIVCQEKNRTRLLEFFEIYDIVSLITGIDEFFY